MSTTPATPDYYDDLLRTRGPQEAFVVAAADARRFVELLRQREEGIAEAKRLADNLRTQVERLVAEIHTYRTFIDKTTGLLGALLKSQGGRMEVGAFWMVTLDQPVHVYWFQQPNGDWLVQCVEPRKQGQERQQNFDEGG